MINIGIVYEAEKLNNLTIDCMGSKIIVRRIKKNIMSRDLISFILSYFYHQIFLPHKFQAGD